MRCNGLAILLIGVLCSRALGQTEVEAPRSDAIVSEKDEVELIDDSSVSEAINRRSRMLRSMGKIRVGR